MNMIIEEPVNQTNLIPTRTRAWRRKINFHKALHKKHISSYYCITHDWYSNLNQYSKNKVHCSCPICKGSKTKAEWYTTGRYARNWKPSDFKKQERMDYDYKEYMQLI